MVPTLMWVNFLVPSTPVSILTTATWNSAFSLAPGNGSALTVLSSMAVTLPMTTASAVATRSGSGEKRMARDVAPWAKEVVGRSDRPATAATATSRVRLMMGVLGYRSDGTYSRRRSAWFGWGTDLL